MQYSHKLHASITTNTRDVQANQQLISIYKQVAKLSQTDRAARCVIILAKSGRLELGDNTLRTL